jgi:hypothetical protein
MIQSKNLINEKLSVIIDMFQQDPFCRRPPLAFSHSMIWNQPMYYPNTATFSRGMSFVIMIKSIKVKNPMTPFDSLATLVARRE